MRLIDADELQLLIQREYNTDDSDYPTRYQMGLQYAMTAIDEAPTIEPPSKLLANITVQYPEVLCVNCRHCEHRNNEEPYCHHHAMVVTPDYFCADSEEGEWMP